MIMKKRILLVSLTCALILSMFSGCIKVVSLDNKGNTSGSSAVASGDFDADAYVKKVWDSQAVPELKGKAVELKDLLTEANGDISKLGDKYGKRAQQEGSSWNFVVKGTATVKSVNTESRAGFVEITLDGYTGAEVLKLQVGPVFKGTSTRDSLDMIKFDDYKNQVAYAALSNSIHKYLTDNMISKIDLKSLQGKSIDFSATFTYQTKDELLLTPYEITVK